MGAAPRTTEACHWLYMFLLHSERDGSGPQTIIDQHLAFWREARERVRTSRARRSGVTCRPRDHRPRPPGARSWRPTGRSRRRGRSWGLLHPRLREPGPGARVRGEDPGREVRLGGDPADHGGPALAVRGDPEAPPPPHGWCGRLGLSSGRPRPARGATAAGTAPAGTPRAREVVRDLVPGRLRADEDVQLLARPGVVVQ